MAYLMGLKENEKNNFYWHYNTPALQYSFLSYLHKKGEWGAEMAALAPKVENSHNIRIRMLKCHSVQHFQFLLDYFKMFTKEKNFNLYYSLAKFKNGIPNQNYGDWNDRDKVNKEFNANCHKEIMGYDLMIDIDAPSFEEFNICYESAFGIKMKLDELNCPYYLRFTGKGFAFVIPHNYIKGYNYLPNDENSIYRLGAKINYYFYENTSELVDRNLSDHRRLIKLPNSLSIYQDRVMVCRCLNEQQFREFALNLYKFDLNDVIDYQSKDHLFNEKGAIKALLGVING